jgi:hypothetical protein
MAAAASRNVAPGLRRSNRRDRRPTVAPRHRPRPTSPPTAPRRVNLDAAAERLS